MAKGSTGFVGFDLVALLQQICSSQIAGVGFIILVSGGFAAFRQAIGASDRFVTVCAKPLSYVRNPYLILALVFIFGHCLSLVITSAAGLAMLMVVTVYPLIIRVGCSSLSAAAVVASVLIIGYAPASGTANLAAELVGLEPIEYFVKYQLFQKTYSKLLKQDFRLSFRTSPESALLFPKSAAARFSAFFPHFTRVSAAFSKVGCIQLKPLEGQ